MRLKCTITSEIDSPIWTDITLLSLATNLDKFRKCVHVLGDVPAFSSMYDRIIEKLNSKCNELNANFLLVQFFNHLTCTNIKIR